LKIPVPGLAIEQQSEDIVVAMCLWGEARGEGPLGMLAVANVLTNRATKHDTSVKAIALQPRQFSTFNADDPNRAHLVDAWKVDPGSWGMAIGVATLSLHGLVKDSTEGALNYLTASLHDSPSAPTWAKDMKVTAKIGNHVFGVA